MEFSFSEIWKLIEKWTTFVKEIHQFEHSHSRYYHNVKRAMQHYRELAEFLRANEPVLRAWMLAYLEKHRRQIFVRWWSNHVSQWATEQIKDNFPEKKLHPDTQRVWDSVFGGEKDTEFSLAYNVVMQAKARREIEACDDLTILAHHEGKQCISNGYYCDMCDSQEYEWRQELIRRITHSQHPLLNADKYYRYLFDKSLDERIEFWSPPHIWGKDYSKRPCNNIYDIDEYKLYLKSYREKYFKRDGQTPMQAAKDFISATLFLSGWNISAHKQDEYEVFFGLWNTLDMIDVVITMDLVHVAEIEAML
jgi:hypothetical protein